MQKNETESPAFYADVKHYAPSLINFIFLQQFRIEEENQAQITGSSIRMRSARIGTFYNVKRRFRRNRIQNLFPTLN
jgi:hypothetical protein